MLTQSFCCFLVGISDDVMVGASGIVQAPVDEEIEGS